MRAKGTPFDLFISGEVVEFVLPGLYDQNTAIGCHGMHHDPGVRSYMNRMSTAAQLREIRDATVRIQETTGRRPIHFRAPNFSADERTISGLAGAGYRIDSSVLPGRMVRRWRVLPVLDHRGAPLVPYHPDEGRLTREGGSPILEVPVTPNEMLPGGPLGLGYLNAEGSDAAVRAAMKAHSRYTTLLAHSWEMVDWGPADPVAPWVRTAGSASLAGFERFLDAFSDATFVNMDRILAAEVDRSRQT